MNFNDYKNEGINKKIKENALIQINFEINLFTDIFSSILVVYYEILGKTQFSNLFSIENLNEFFLNMIFKRNENIHSILYDIYIGINKDREDILIEIYKKHINRSPEFFGIPLKWNLNDKIQKFPEFFQKVKENFKKIEKYRSPYKN